MIIMNVIKILMITRDLRCLALVWKNCGTTLAGHHPFLAVGQGAIPDHDDDEWGDDEVMVMTKIRNL